MITFVRCQISTFISVVYWNTAVSTSGGISLTNSWDPFTLKKKSLISSFRWREFYFVSNIFDFYLLSSKKRKIILPCIVDNLVFHFDLRQQTARPIYKCRKIYASKLTSSWLIHWNVKEDSILDTDR